MIYQCYDCEKLYDGSDGYMKTTTTFGFGIVSGGSMVFICKNCMSENGKRIIEEIKKKKITSLSLK